MRKDSEIKYAEKLIFSYLVKSTETFDQKDLLSKQNDDDCYKALQVQTHSVKFIFGILSRCDSMTKKHVGWRQFRKNKF